MHAANYGGKLKTTLQIAGIGLTFWHVDAFLGWFVHPLGVLTLWAALAVTIYTGVVYVKEFRAA